MGPHSTRPYCPRLVVLLLSLPVSGLLLSILLLDGNHHEEDKGGGGRGRGTHSLTHTPPGYIHTSTHAHSPLSSFIHTPPGYTHTITHTHPTLTPSSSTQARLPVPSLTLKTSATPKLRSDNSSKNNDSANQGNDDYYDDDYNDNDNDDGETEAENAVNYWHADYYKKYKTYPKHVMFSDVYKPGFVVENGSRCRKNETSRVFVFINSRVASSGPRQAIRESYVRELTGRGVGYAFLLSRPTTASSLVKVREENALHGDIVVTGSEESYRHLTTKTAHLLDWVAANCPGTTQYVTKVDDDVYVNVPRFLQVLATPRTLTILGKVCSNCVPFRGVGASLGESLRLSPGAVVTRRHLPLNALPPFAMGPAYALTADVVGLLLKAAKEMVYFGYEDVFWTGLAVEEANQLPWPSSSPTLDPASIKHKLANLGRHHTAATIRREDVAGWRVDVRGSVKTPTSTAAILHNVDWQTIQ